MQSMLNSRIVDKNVTDVNPRSNRKLYAWNSFMITNCPHSKPIQQLQISEKTSWINFILIVIISKRILKY